MGRSIPALENKKIVPHSSVSRVLARVKAQRIRICVFFELENPHMAFILVTLETTATRLYFVTTAGFLALYGTTGVQ